MYPVLTSPFSDQIRLRYACYRHPSGLVARVRQGKPPPTPPHNPRHHLVLTSRQYSYAQVFVACMPYPLTKVSMLFFYLRLAPLPTFRKVCFSIITYILAASTVVTLLNLFSCTPVSGGWDHSPELGAKCINATNFYYFYGSMSVVTDVLLMVLPIPILLRLQLRRKVKYGLVAMFVTGTL